MHLSPKRNDELFTIEFSNIEDHTLMPSFAKVVLNDRKFESAQATLVIKKCQLNSQEFDALIKIVQTLKNLTEIQLIQNNLKGNQLIELINSIQSFQLKGFILSDNWIDESHAEEIIKLLAKFKMDVLDLSLDWLHSSGVYFLLENLVNGNVMKSLNISCDDFQPQALKPLSSCTKNQLNCLDVSYNLIDGMGLRPIVDFLENNNELEELHLNSNKIGDLGANILAEGLRNNDKLKILNIADNEISTEGFMHLLNALSSHKTIEKIYVSNNKINQKIIEDRPVIYNKDHQFSLIIS